MNKLSIFLILFGIISFFQSGVVLAGDSNIANTAPSKRFIIPSSTIKADGTSNPTTTKFAPKVNLYKVPDQLVYYYPVKPRLYDACFGDYVHDNIQSPYTLQYMGKGYLESVYTPTNDSIINGFLIVPETGPYNIYAYATVCAPYTSPENHNAIYLFVRVYNPPVPGSGQGYTYAYDLVSGSGTVANGWEATIYGFGVNRSLQKGQGLSMMVREQSSGRTTNWWAFVRGKIHIKSSCPIYNSSNPGCNDSN